MALKLILGNSGSGKTYFVHNKVIQLSKDAPGKNFLVIVPEQFTMQTQRELVRMHPGHSIMNIDVLSFRRLAYRVFDELGSFNSRVLEETGKNLVLRRIAEEQLDSLTVLKKNITKMGYIGEVKSFLSELAQYNISPRQLAEAVEKLPQGSFSYKLSDVLLMYQGFLDFLEGRFVTAEEILELLAEVADRSEILRDSVIVFDGFTGFTPVQNLLVKELMGIAQDIYVTVTIDIRENPYHCTGIHELFAMSKKMIKSLREMAEELHVAVDPPVLMQDSDKTRFCASPSLHFLEQNLFRSQKQKVCPDEEPDIEIRSLKNPREELYDAARRIERFVRRDGYRYKDIAIVCGDLPGYANYASEVFAEYKIPVFIDQKMTIIFHPFIEYLRAILEVVICDFSIESVFRYLKSGFSGIKREETDLLENYCLAAGIFGHRKWSERFCYQPGEETEESLAVVNEIREKFMHSFEGLYQALQTKNSTVEEITIALYRFLCEANMQQELKRKEMEYEALGDLKNAKEYAQIYKIVMDLFDKMVELLGDEVIPLREYAKIIDSGFESAKIGIIPPGYDRVVFGDIERTRLDQIKILFFVGVNDGVIPKTGGSDGLLSQMEREQLNEMQLELAPTMREKVFMQKFYLYLNLTKPSHKLYLSYARVNGEGRAMQSSYLVHTLCRLFEHLSVNEIDNEPFAERIVTAESARRLLIEGMESAAEWNDRNREEEIRYWAALCRWYQSQDVWKEEVERLFAAVSFKHTDTPISASVTRALYGTVLQNSVTRLENFASCAFSHFLSYGLNLKERRESGFYAVDFGNIFHAVLELFAEGIQRNNYSWFSITQEESEALLTEAMEQALFASHNLALYENARSRYAKDRMLRILKRTVSALIYQVRKGKFIPDDFEVSFSYAEDLKSVNFRLSEEEKMQLKGRIDRIDTCVNEDRLYVKIIDYKSGNASFQFLNVYHGLQLQLVVYMNAAMEIMAKKHPDHSIVPAGIFYYHINDPMVESDDNLSDEELSKKIFGELKLNGIANEDRSVIERLDEELQGAQSANSDVIPVGVNKDGSLKKASKTLATSDFTALSAYVNETILHLGQRMMKGDVSVSPYALAEKTGCDFCEFRSVCHFDSRAPGFSYRRLKELSEEELLCEMRGADHQ